MHLDEHLADYSAIELLQEAHNVKELQARFVSIRGQTAISTALLCIFLRNTYYALCVIFRRPDRLASWCCLFMCMTGTLVLAITLLGYNLTGEISCRESTWMQAIGDVIFNTVINIIMLERAYLAYRRNKWMLVFGIPILIIPPALYLYVFSSDVVAHFDTEYACHTTYPKYIPYVHALLDLPACIVFSVAFFIVVYRQYSLVGHQCWQKLARDGIIAMLAIIFADIFCLIGNLAFPVYLMNDIIFLLDW
ncbi:hypothetical protein BDF19DRAFT_191823 [Syncephalis fuscata]|nr:hypothetical protein BDF19DRAFT_191823 [Syncephalis fuscata]